MKGKRDFVEDYCRISLLPVIFKVLERFVLAVVRDHVSSLISCEQHGFLAGRSCLIQLTGVLCYIAGQLDAGKQIHIKYLNVSKAFEKVDHAKLLGRLHQYGITCKLHDLFRSYLQVTVLEATSRELQVTSRVPQGSLLGPILFLLQKIDPQKNAYTALLYYQFYQVIERQCSNAYFSYQLSAHGMSCPLSYAQITFL